MKILNVCEFITEYPLEGTVMKLEEMKINGCTGCWTCWWKTPGRCVFKDLDNYYSNYVNADKVVFFLETKRGFVSSKVKRLFDRMITLFLPYTDFTTGESMHHPRYEKYPSIEIIYKDDFISEE
ncbi:MAG: hypothetical protein ACK5LC_11700 [Coprobacillaceae bacterium]